jgi:hypothetical protein
VIYLYGSWFSIGCSSFALTLDCSRRLSCRVQVALLVGRYAEVHSQRSSAGVGSLRLAIPIGHLYFCELFHLGKLSQNDDPHSKPITKPMALSDANCRQWRLMTGAKHGTLYRIVRGTASLQTGCCAPLCNNACDGHKCKPCTGTTIHFSDLLVDFVLAFRRRVSSATSFERPVGVG